MMNKILSITIAIVLIIASFFIGYSLNKPDSTSTEIQNLQSQIDSLQQQNNNLTMSIEELQSKEKTCWESWENAVKIIYSGQVKNVFTTHKGLLSLSLKDGSWVRDVQMPSYVSIQDILNRCGDKCKDIRIATE